MPEKIDYNFLSEREGGRTLFAYVPDGARSKSGATVATGFDLGQRNSADLEGLNLSRSLINKLTPYLSLKNENASAAIKSNPLMLTPSQADEIDKVVKTAHVKKLIKKYNSSVVKGGARFEELPGGAQTAIASVSFQYGTNLDKATPDFWTAITTQDWAKTKEVLNDFGDRYPTRRKLEANLFVIADDDK